MAPSRPVRLALVIGFILSLIAAVPASANGATPFVVPPGARFVPNEVLVEFRAGASASQRADARRTIGVVRSEAVSPLAGNLELAVLPPGRSVADAVRSLQSNAAVAFAEPNWIYTHGGHGTASNDPYYTGGSLWGMYGDQTSPANQYGSQAGEAWAAGRIGSSSVHIGVIDEGIDLNHPDLNANIWTNPFDPVDGIDNDGNRYIDDIHGWDFVNNDRSIYDPKNKRDKSTDAHGTHVAGTIGAERNGAGVVGVNWHVTIISAKFLGANGGTTLNAIKAVDYITDLRIRHGLNIPATNNSWGGGGYSQALFDAINRADNAGILFVAAAGNGGSDGVGDNNDSAPHYPSSYANDNIISVASITNTGAKSGWSNYGATSVDLAAPGSGIWSTTPRNRYDAYGGTSMATPHVTGAVALYASTHAGASDEQIRSVILATTTPTPSMAGKTVTGGRLDAAAAAGS